MIIVLPSAASLIRSAKIAPLETAGTAETTGQPGLCDWLGTATSIRKLFTVSKITTQSTA